MSEWSGRAAEMHRFYIYYFFIFYILSAALDRFRADVGLRSSTHARNGLPHRN